MSAPLLWSTEVIEGAEHVTDAGGWCWCQPRMEDVLPFGAITVHRHFWDRPEYSEDDMEESTDRLLCECGHRHRSGNDGEDAGCPCVEDHDWTPVTHAPNEAEGSDG